MATSKPKRKPVLFNPSARRDWDDLPANIQDDFGHALRDEQEGRRPLIGKTLRGFGGAHVIELRENDRAGTYRAVYTVEYKEAIYVLHAFTKKSHKGVATDIQDLELIHTRLKWAEMEHQLVEEERGGKCPKHK